VKILETVVWVQARFVLVDESAMAVKSDRQYVFGFGLGAKRIVLTSVD
jgi:hypothetical protein